MINNFALLTSADLIMLIITFTISALVHLSIIKISFRDNVCYLIKKLFQIRNSQPILYSYRHVSLMIASYFLILCSFLIINLFYLILAIYAYCGIQINIPLVLYSELSIKIIAILGASLLALSILLYYIRNSDHYMKLLKDNYCLLEALLSVLLCAIYIAGVKHSRPTSFMTVDFPSFMVVASGCFILLCIFLHKLQTKKKESLRKQLFGNSKIRELVALSKQENIELLYNVLLCDGLTLLLTFYIDTLTDVNIAKAIAYVLLQILFVGITKGYKTSINVIIKTKEEK